MTEEKKKEKEPIKKDTEEKIVSDKKNEDIKNPPKKKKNTKRTQKTDNTKLSTLVDLVDSLDDKENIFLRLSMNNYFNQYMEEKEYRRMGYEIAPYINVEEFNKKMKKQIKG